MTVNSQLLTTEPKNKNKLSKQLEQEQNHRNDWAQSQMKEMKALQSEIKENIQRTNSDRKETGTQINSLDQKKERKIQAQQNEETRFQKKMRRG